MNNAPSSNNNTASNIDATAIITRQEVAEDQRSNITADLFGAYYPLRLEPFIFSVTSQLSEDYSGGSWQFHTLSNGGFYMAPVSDGNYQVSSENGYEGFMSSDALGITACLYAYSHLSFSRDESFAEICARQYHWLRDYMLDHTEARAILRAID